MSNPDNVTDITVKLQAKALTQKVQTLLTKVENLQARCQSAKVDPTLSFVQRRQAQRIQEEMMDTMEEGLTRMEAILDAPNEG